MKMPNKTLLIIIILTIAVAISSGQTNRISISLGQASDNTFTQSEPAKIMGTYPSDDTTGNSYLINSYLSIGYNFTEHFKVSIVGELQRNTLIDKKQHVEQIGVQLSKFFILISDKNATQKLTLYSNLSYKYSNDKVKKKEGAQLVFSNSMSFPAPIGSKNYEWLNLLRPNVFWPSDQISDGKSVGATRFIQIRHKHSFGIDNIRYESLTMGNLTFGIELYPFNGLLYNLTQRYNLLQLYWNYVYRFDISNSKSDLYVGPLSTRGISLAYNFDKENKNSISFGYEYINGGNPLKGLEDQKYGQLTIKAKINI